MKHLSIGPKGEIVSRRLWRDRRGAVLVYVTLLLVVLLGGAALVIDGGRVMTLQSELQGAADAAALAAAAELDRRPDSIIRADLALANLVQNDQRFASGPNAVTIAGRRFLSALPDDEDPYSDATVTADPLEVRFVDVMVQTRAIDTSFAQFISSQTSASTGARAVAGFDQAVCNFTPLFICNPYEVGAVNQGPGGYADIFDAVADPAFRRRQVKLAQLGGNDQPSPGNFGFLEDAAGPGGQALRNALAQVSPDLCFIQNGVDTKTGATTGPVRQAMNVRFDIYDGNMNSNKSDPAYRPAMNVTKGYTGNNACNLAPEADPNVAMGLPRDGCYPNGCAQMGPSEGRMGDGAWDFDTYWAMNHGGAAPNGWSNANRPSRYEVYRHEVNTPAIPAAGTPALHEEDGAPACYNPNPSGVTADDSPDRRMVYAAVINCEGVAASDPGLQQGANTGIPVEAWIKMFVTEPIGSVDGDPANTKDAIYVEMTGILEPGSGTVEEDELLRDIVQLYR